jgi:hypothetical protein
MESLITIETVPIKIEFVEKNPLALSSVHPADTTIKQANQQPIQIEPIKIAVQDYYEPSLAYQWENATYTAIPQYDDGGNLKLDIQMEDGQAREIRFMQTNRSIESMTSKARAVGTDAGTMQISIPMSQLASGMPEANNFNTEFLPPDLQLVVTQRADVIIKYVGGPIYVPPSSDPNYTPPIGFENKNEQLAGMQLNQKV